ncbi:1-acylglycerol-3-phosphate O-acyltransferase [Malassezia psittaci]|uniref:1-acyl-sn-glycerol-3-phosphate acyltransferase n=1 Tax=Malassezia psittaci TaxID=1821823 RepID=A0AAF0F5D6_9BASI|nr:1-acylglycerol-3-phosphate O-acyltransferase [Malassezia psittaci]
MKLGSSLVSFFSASFLLFSVASARSQRVRYYYNAMLYVFSLGVCSTIGVLYPLIFGIFGQRYNTNYVVARSFYMIAGTLIGYDVSLKGAEHLQTRPGIILGNHQSFLDILYLGCVMPRRSVIMAKKELKILPILGQFMMLSGALFIDRKSRTSAIKTMSEGGARMRREKLALFAFPEGTRSHSILPELLPFKKGVFHLAIETQLPIIPVVCENYSRIYDSKTRFEGGDLRLVALPPISTEGMTDKDTDKLIKTVYDAMLKQLLELDQDNDSKDAAFAAQPPSRDPPRVRGLAGLFARIVGDGRNHQHNRTIRRVARDEDALRANAHGGTQSSDYGLVSSAHSTNGVSAS